MQITCQHCSNNFEYDVPVYAQGEGSAPCPSCGRDTPAVDSWAALGGGGGDLFGGGGGDLFGGGGGGGGEARVYCFNCGKAMTPREGELIPVCDECRQDASSPASGGGTDLGATAESGPGGDALGDEPVADWMIRKANGNVYGPFPVETIIDWIKARKINPDEEIAHIGGAWRLFGQHEEFGRYFEASGDVTVGGHGTSEIDFRRRSPVRDALRSGGRLGAALAVLVVVGGGAWFLIANDVLVIPEATIDRVADRVSDSGRRSDDGPQRTEDAQKLVDELGAAYPELAAGDTSSMEHYLRGRTLMLRDSVADIEAARTELEKAVVLDNRNALALGGLAELYSLMAYRQIGSLDLQRQSIYLVTMAEDQSDFAAETLRSRAAWLIYTQNFAEGMSFAQQGLQHDPGDPSLHFLLGVGAAGKAGEVTEAARAHFDKAVELDPGFHQVWYELGVGEEDAGNLRAAIDHYSRKIELDPRAASAHTRLGLIYEGIGDYQKASGHLDQALALHPRGIDAVMHRAVLAYQIDGNPALTITLLEGLMKPDGPELTIRERKEAGIHLSAARRLAGDPAGALAAVNEVLEEDRTWPAGLFHKGLALMAQGRGAEAITEFSAAESKDLTTLERATILFWQGRAAMAAQQTQDALSNYGRATEIDPDFVPAYLWQAEVSFSSGSGADPNSAVHGLMGHVGRDSLTYARVREPSLFFQPLPDLEPLARLLKGEAAKISFAPNLYAATGIVLFHQGKYNDAADYLSKAVQQDNRSEGALFYLGLVQYQQGRHSMAGAAFLGVLGIVHNRGVYHVYLGDAQLEQGKTDDAIASYEKAHGYGAKSAWSHTRLGEALAREGSNERAAAEFALAKKLDPAAVAPRRLAFQLNL